MIEQSILNDRKLLNLQKMFRNGQIKENDLSITEIKQLKELYKMQIEYVEKSIEKDKKELMNFKADP